jgi:hypothetical protein
MADTIFKLDSRLRGNDKASKTLSKSIIKVYSLKSA